ncbi:MAG TPA: TetR/AcrR family transcriptional regulator [Pseudonocardiaceae bacterium]|nr:TetR/AcrR family transcriptional regulator [Pseudonocardiaceae bacterium]
MPDTRTRLLEGALETLRTKGIAGASARSIAAAAGVNQALVFYHFGSVHELLSAACTESARERVASYIDDFDAVTSLAELLQLGMRIHDVERANGNLIVLAQLLAGAQSDPDLAAPTALALKLWIDVIEQVLHRVLASSPFADVLDIPGLAKAISAAFVGLELYDGIDASGAESALSAIAQLGALIDVVEDLGPASRRVLRSKLRRSANRS